MAHIGELARLVYGGASDKSRFQIESRVLVQDRAVPEEVARAPLDRDRVLNDRYAGDILEQCGDRVARRRFA